MNSFVMRFWFMFVLLLSVAAYITAWHAIARHLYPSALFLLGLSAIGWFFCWSRAASPIRSAKGNENGQD